MLILFSNIAFENLIEIFTIIQKHIFSFVRPIILYDNVLMHQIRSTERNTKENYLKVNIIHFCY